MKNLENPESPKYINFEFDIPKGKSCNAPMSFESNQPRKNVVRYSKILQQWVVLENDDDLDMLSYSEITRKWGPSVVYKGFLSDIHKANSQFPGQSRAVLIIPWLVANLIGNFKKYNVGKRASIAIMEDPLSDVNITKEIIQMMVCSNCAGFDGITLNAIVGKQHTSTTMLDSYLFAGLTERQVAFYKRQSGFPYVYKRFKTRFNRVTKLIERNQAHYRLRLHKEGFDSYISTLTSPDETYLAFVKYDNIFEISSDVSTKDNPSLTKRIALLIGQYRIFADQALLMLDVNVSVDLMSEFKTFLITEAKSNCYNAKIITCVKTQNAISPAGKRYCNWFITIKINKINPHVTEQLLPNVWSTR